MPGYDTGDEVSLSGRELKWKARIKLHFDMIKGYLSDTECEGYRSALVFMEKYPLIGEVLRDGGMDSPEQRERIEGSMDRTAGMLAASEERWEEKNQEAAF